MWLKEIDHFSISFDYFSMLNFSKEKQKNPFTGCCCGGWECGMAFGGPAFRKFGGGTAPCGIAAVSFCGGGGCCFKTEHKYSRFVATLLKKKIEFLITYLWWMWHRRMRLNWRLLLQSIKFQTNYSQRFTSEKRMSMSQSYKCL